MHHIPIFGHQLNNASRHLGLDFVEDFHRFDDAHDLIRIDHAAYAYERRRIG